MPSLARRRCRLFLPTRLIFHSVTSPPLPSHLRPAIPPVSFRPSPSPNPLMSSRLSRPSPVCFRHRPLPPSPAPLHPTSPNNSNKKSEQHHEAYKWEEGNGIVEMQCKLGSSRASPQGASGGVAHTSRPPKRAGNKGAVSQYIASARGRRASEARFPPASAGQSQEAPSRRPVVEAGSGLFTLPNVAPSPLIPRAR